MTVRKTNNDKGFIVRKNDQTRHNFVTLTYKGQIMRLYGGPFESTSKLFEGMHRVKLDRVLKGPFEDCFHIPDFSVPEDIKHFWVTVFRMCKILIKDKQMLVGCRGGIGRTGLMMASIFSVFEKGDPVVAVREEYLPYAVETAKQEAFVRKFDGANMARYLWMPDFIFGGLVKLGVISFDKLN